MLALLLCFGLIALIDLTPILKQKNWKDTIAFCVLFALTLAVAILDQLGMPPPSTVLALDGLLRNLHLYYR